jgi:hypothetical protein
MSCDLRNIAFNYACDKSFLMPGETIFLTETIEGRPR